MSTWIKHLGVECPVELSDKVCVRYAGGVELDDDSAIQANRIPWWVTEGDSRVAYYRVIEKSEGVQ